MDAGPSSVDGAAVAVRPGPVAEAVPSSPVCDAVCPPPPPPLLPPPVAKPEAAGKDTDAGAVRGQESPSSWRSTSLRSLLKSSKAEPSRSLRTLLVSHSKVTWYCHWFALLPIV